MNTQKTVPEQRVGELRKIKEAIMRYGKIHHPIVRTLIATAISACFSPLVFALPVAPNVSNGNASFVQNGNTLTVTNSNRAIINWNSFSIGGNENVRFVQPSSTSSVLNRVTGSDPSVLLGSLQSNGRVFLINPAGILVGQGARIDVAGFVAATLSLSDSDFLANRLRFTETAGAGKVQIFGEITTPSGGSVYLIAPQVENHGIITAPNGEVLLAAGQRVELIDSATPGVKVEIVGNEGNATNLGTITAEAGRIGIAGVLVKNSGTLNASSLVSEGGRIFLKATTDTLVEGNSQITATGNKGGRIEVLGHSVSVTDNTLIDASGKTAGGTVLVGGDYQGKNAAVQNAETTTFSKDAIIRANASDKGDGGKVIVWADGTTSAYGKISARGGANGGNGGFVEVSGKQHLVYRGVTDTRAPLGKTGTLLLDPTSIGLVAGTGTDGIPTDTLYGNNITTNLGSSNVILQTGSGGTGNITFTAGTYNFSSATAANSLSLLAYSDGGTSTGNISLPSGTFITMKVGAPLIMVAGWDGVSTSAPAVVNGFGNIQMVGSSISAQGGGATILAGSYINLIGSSVSTVASNMFIKAGGDIFLDATSAPSSTLGGSGSYQWVEAGGNLKLWAGDGGSAVIQYYGSGTQTAKGASIEVRADKATTNVSSHQASIHSNSHQNIFATAGGINVFGGGYMGFGTNNTAGISAAGNQQVSATGNIAVTGGTSGGSSNSAEISANGAQNISAANISVTGGNSTGFGGAYIKAMGAQTITTSAAITLSGGSVSIGNEASITSDTSQTLGISGNLSLTGGSAAGAYVGAPVQNINVGGILTMNAGSGVAVDAYGMAAPAAIGNDINADITLNVGGSISLSGNNALNRAIIGAATGTADIYLRGTDISLGNYSILGNWDGSVGGNATLIATGTSIQQLANGNIGTRSLTATANTDIALNGINKVDLVDLTATGGFVSYHTANPNTTRIGAIATGNITVSGDAGSTAIQLVELRTTGTSSIAVTAQGQILEGDWSGNSDVGVADIITGSGNVTLTSVIGTPVADTLAISADVATTGTVSAVVLGGPYGSIGIRDVGSAAASVVNINAGAASSEGDISYFRYGNLNLGGGTAVTLTPKTGETTSLGASGNIIISSNLTMAGAASALMAGGDMTITSGLVTMTGDSLLSAGGNLDVTGGNVSMSGSTNAVFSGGTLTIASGKTITAGAGSLDVVAGALAISGTLSGFGDTMVITPGNIDITSGGVLTSTAGKLTFLADSMNVTSGSVNGYLGIDGTLFGGLTLGALAGGTGTMNAGNGIVDLAIGGTGIDMFNGSYINSTDATQPEGGLIKIFFAGISGGGSMIDGVATFDGGYKINNSFTTLGVGLDVTYGVLSNPVSDALVDAFDKTTDSAGGTSETLDSLELAATPTFGVGGTQSTGGTDGSFGNEEVPASGSGSTTGNNQGGTNAKKKPAQCSA
jgi:filamentous hemagglutinin family protein